LTSRPAGTGRKRAGVIAALVILAMAVPAQAEPLPVREVAEGVYLYQGAHSEASAENHGGIANIGFVVGDEAVAVIDSGGSAHQGRRLREAIRQVTDLPIQNVINTHVHPDHVFGNAAFLADEPLFLGHAKLPRALAARGQYYLERLEAELGEAAGGTKVVPPLLTVSVQGGLSDEDVAAMAPGVVATSPLDIDLGGRMLRLTAYPTAHTDNDLTVLDVRTATLWTGDLLFRERVPVVDGSLKGWLEAMATLRRVEARRVIPGHGAPTADWPAALDRQERYLRLLRDEIRAVIRDGGTMEQAVASVAAAERDAWLLFDDYNPRNVVTAFTELEWE